MSGDDEPEREEEESRPERNFLTPSDYELHRDEADQYKALSTPAPVDPAKAWKFDEKTREVYLRALAATGIKGMSAHIAGVSALTVRNHRRSDKDFARREAEAELAYNGRLENELNRQGLEGEWEPQFGRVARDQDGVVGYVKRKNFRALELLVKKRMPAYARTGHSEGEGGARTGVLVVYPIKSAAEWERDTAGERLPRDPLHGIEGAEGLLLEDKSPRRRLPGADDEE